VVLLASATAQAQDGNIHRCIGENGEPTFSDQKCSSLNGTNPTEPQTTAPDQSPYNALPTTRSATPAITQTCATSADDLRNRVAALLGASNAIGFSGLFLWDGLGQGSAMAPLRDLATLVREPLIAVDLDSTLQFREPDPTDRDDERREGDERHELVIRTVGEQDRHVPFESVHRYEMREQAGCWWLLIPW